MKSTATLQRVEWLGMQLFIPSDWEIVRHSVAREKGRLAFVDHRSQRLLLRWAASDKAPDEERLFDDYKSRELEAGPEVEFSELPRRTGWNGFRATRDDEVITRAGRYDPVLKRWIEMVLSWPHEFDPALEGMILREFATNQEADATGCFRAFGIDIGIPSEGVLHSVDVKPGELRVVFHRGRAEITIHRVGMAAGWFDGDVEAFLRKQLNGAAPEISLRDYHGIDACFSESRVPGRSLKRLLLRPRERRDITWFSADADAVVQIMTLSPRNAPELPEEWTVDIFQQCSTDGGNSQAGHVELLPGETGGMNGAQMLDAVPVRNASAKTGRTASGELLLRVPLEQRWYMRPPFSWVLPFSKERSVALDPVGESVWRACDGRRTVGNIVETFSTANRLSFHEARLGVMQFLRSLTRRGFIAIALPGEEER